LSDRTQPVEVSLVTGQNVLRFSHQSDGFAKGFTVQEFTSKPRR
jgi:hypothetical protein